VQLLLLLRQAAWHVARGNRCGMQCSISLMSQLLGEQFDGHHPLTHLTISLARKYQRTLVRPAPAANNYKTTGKA